MDKLEEAQHPETTPERLVELARDTTPTVRYGVAQHPDTPASVLDELSRDESSLVRQGVAMNPNTSDSTIVLLTKDSDITTANAARTTFDARNSNTVMWAMGHAY